MAKKKAPVTAPAAPIVLRTIYIPYEMSSWLQQMAYTRSVTRGTLIGDLVADAFKNRKDDQPFMAQLPLPKASDMDLRSALLSHQDDMRLRKISYATGISKSELIRALLREARTLCAQRGELTFAERLEQAQKKPARKKRTTPKP